MEITVTVDDKEVLANLKKLDAKMLKAMQDGLKDTIVDIARDAIKGSPVKTGNNRRSISYESKGLTASTFSTSGYGGYLETGYTMRNGRRMAGRPYFKPALDRNLPKLGSHIKEHL